MNRTTVCLTAALAIAAGHALAAPAGLAAQAPPPELLRFVVAPTGNEARYLVREQLLGFDFPNDAVGVTGRVEGQVVVDAAGRVVADGSRIVVDLSGLTSDQDRRDNFIKHRTLDTESYPRAVFVPRRFEGLAWPMAAGSDVSFRMVGDMTVREATREVVWSVTARMDGDAVVGRAATRFPFGHFDLEIPRVRSVLSVDDDIRLEYDFRLVPAR